MKRVKQIATFTILAIIFAIFTDYMAKVGLRNSYKTISGEIKSVSPQITVTDAKTTDVQGYLKADVKNNSEEKIEKIYIKLDLFSKRDVNLGTEYLEINDLEAGKERSIEIKYKYSNVDHYEITTKNEKNN